MFVPSGAPQPASAPAPRPAVAEPPSTQPASAEQVAEAKDKFRRGSDLFDRKATDADWLLARQLLSESLASGALPDDLAKPCRADLTELTKEIIFSRRVFEADPYAYRYVVKGGDVLVNVVKAEDSLVPAEGIQLINKVADPRSLQVGQWLKMVRGPFDAIITKHAFTLDLYQRGMFVKTYRVGLGQNGSTPVGYWMVAPGGRTRQAPWTPPPASQPEASRVIRWGQPGYPLGKDGLWIALIGTDRNTEMLRGFGIHGTNDPASIGKQASLGCVRLADEDINELFSLLYDGKSKVEVRP